MKKTVAPGAKTPLFDLVFKPEIITLENGHTVTRPRSRTPLIALLVFAALDKVGILDKAYIRCDQLSGGQQQRVALARTLNQNPSIILADEPVAALDPVTAHQVMADFKRINEEMNITILINIHHVDLALGYAQRVVGIRAGEIVYDGPASEVTQDILDSIYNGSAVPQAGGN